MRNSVPYDTSRSFLLTFYRTSAILLSMDNRAEIPYGTLDLMVLKTLDTLGPQHGYGIARRIERSEEHTSELQSLRHLVCRLLLEKTKDRAGRLAQPGGRPGPAVCRWPVTRL